MEDLKASVVAAAIGSVAVTGLWLARPANSRESIRVVEQWTPAAHEGPDGDAAVAFRIVVRGAVREALDEERSVGFRLADRAGHDYSLFPMSGPAGDLTLKLPRGYANGLREPRIVAVCEGKTIASMPVAPVPEPFRTELRPTKTPPLKVVLQGGRGLKVQPAAPIPSDEAWQVETRRTPFVAVHATTVVDRFGGHDPRHFTLPYAEEAGVVEIDLTRYRLVPHRGVVRIPGLRLESRYGGTALVVDKSLRVANDLGLDIVLPCQDNGPHRAVRHGDPRSAIVNLSFHPIQKDDPSHGWSQGRRMRAEILSPSPEELGLKEIRLGIARRRSTKANAGSLRTTPFTLTARITMLEPVLIDTVRTVVPIEVAPAPFGAYRPR